MARETKAQRLEREAEREDARKAAVRQAALAKLSKEEREMLGV